MEQIIWTGNEYEIANLRNSKQPSWPVQDQGGRWHNEKFDGQRVCFPAGQSVSLGIEVEQIPESELPHDDDGNLNYDASLFAGDVYVTLCGRVYK